MSTQFSQELRHITIVIFLQKLDGCCLIEITSKLNLSCCFYIKLPSPSPFKIPIHNAPCDVMMLQMRHKLLCDVMNVILSNWCIFNNNNNNKIRGGAPYSIGHFDGLVQERRNSLANALELRLSCTNPSIEWYYFCVPLCWLLRVWAGVASSSGLSCHACKLIAGDGDAV